MTDNIVIEQPWIPASKKRRALAIYVDFLLFSAVVALACWALGTIDPTLAAAPLSLQLTVFLVVELVLLKVISWSPGYWALAIYQKAEPGQRPLLVVSPQVTSVERWWTILLGVLIVLEGTKMAVRWALWHPPIPFMGTQLESIPSAIVSVLMGSALCAIGLLVLRGRPKAALAGVVLYSVALLSAILSYELWSSWVAADVVARREFQGVPIREGEVAAMQRWAPAVIVGGPTLMLLWLAATARRFWRVH